MDTRIVTQEQVEYAARNVANEICSKAWKEPLLLYGVPRGGVPCTYLVSKYLEGRIRNKIVTDGQLGNESGPIVVIDDVFDSGATRERFHNYPFYTLFTKRFSRPWLVFPWEVNPLQSDESREDVPRRLLQIIGEDPRRGGLLETPKRYISAWEEMTCGYKEDPREVLKVFEDGAEKCDELILLKDVSFFSNCEHHLLPFIGTFSIGYIPNGRIVGVSKLSRVFDVFAKRLQVQERLTNQVADCLDDELKPLAVGVIVRARHLCMELRGIKKANQEFITSALRGVLRTESSARTEFLSLVK